MADIKCCDQCGAFFNPRGPWQSLTAATFTIEDGRQERYDATLELCGACAIDPRKAATPQVALGTGPRQVDAGQDIWRRPGDPAQFFVKRGRQEIGPFSSFESAEAWVRSERDHGDVLDPIEDDL